MTGDIVIWGLDTVDTARNGNQHMASSNGLIHLKALEMFRDILGFFTFEGDGKSNVVDEKN